MVSQERIKRAETEAELREAKMEKEALKSALRVVEGENGRMRRGSLIYPIMKEESVEEVGGVNEEEDECRAVDLDEVRKSQTAMDEAKHEEEEKVMVTDPEADPGPSVSRSSSRIGLKSPVHSRQPSESMSMSGDVPPSVPGPISALSHIPSSSPAPLPAESEPQPQPQLHSIDVRPLVQPPSASVSVSLQNQKNTSSSSLLLDEYETPMSRSQSLSQDFSPPDVHHNLDASHTQPAPIPISEHEEDVHERGHHEPHQDEHEHEHTAWNTDDTTTTTALQNEVPTSNAAPSFSYTSPPNPDFKPSSPRNYLVDEPSPWA